MRDKSIAKPWDDVPESSAQRRTRKTLNAFIYIVSTPLALAAFSLALWPILIEEGTPIDVSLWLYALFVVTLGALLLIYKIYRSINRTVKLQMINGLSVVPPVSVTDIGWFRAFLSEEPVSFGPGWVKIQGTLSGDLRIGYAVGTMGVFFYSIWGFTPDSIVYGVIMLGWMLSLAYMVSYAVRPRGSSKSLLISERDIASIRCHGPLIRIMFSNRPAPGIRGLYIYPTQFSRDAFFRDFDSAFPMLLPIEYRSAVEWDVVPQSISS